MCHELVHLPKPQPRCAINVRAAVKDDLPFIDAVQKMHSHMVGFLPNKQIEKYIEGGHVLVAEELGSRQKGPPPWQ